MAEAAANERWSDSVRAAPLGVLLVAGVLALLGALVVLSGIYLALSAREVSWFAWVSALLLGPVALYLALNLVRRARWAWLATVLMLALLLASSVARAGSSPGFPLSPLVEIAVEGLAIAYLARPSVRRQFRGA